jgi:hypothetical protein
MFRALIILLLICTGAHAQETVTSYDNKTLPVLNEELRRSRASLRSLEDQMVAMIPVSLTASVSGVLPIANGGTGAATAQAAIDALLPSQATANGKYLTSNGSASSWGTVAPSGLSLVSTTTWTDSDGTGVTTTIDPTKNYFAIFQAVARHSGDYETGWTCFFNNASGYLLNSGNNARAITSKFYIYKKQTQFSGQGFHGYLVDTIAVSHTTPRGPFQVFGMGSASGSTSFTIIASLIFSGTLKLYEIVQ